jgi:hypothetical protein
MKKNTLLGLSLLGVLVMVVAVARKGIVKQAGHVHGAGCTHQHAHDAPVSSNNAVQSVHGMSETETSIVEYPFSASGTLNVANTNGSIVIEKHDANMLIIKSVKTTDIGHLNDIEIKISVVNGVANIETIEKNPHLREACAHGASVDYVIKVPADTVVHAKNVNGSIASVGIKNVSAHTVNGSIDTDNVEQAQLQTVSGELSASFSGSVKQSSLKSINGSVNVSLPASYQGSVATSTMNGAVQSDFPRDHNAHVHLQTMNGSIQATRS